MYNTPCALCSMGRMTDITAWSESYQKPLREVETGKWLPYLHSRTTAGPHDSFLLLFLGFLCELYQKTVSFNIIPAFMGNHGKEALALHHGCSKGSSILKQIINLTLFSFSLHVCSFILALRKLNTHVDNSIQAAIWHSCFSSCKHPI